MLISVGSEALKQPHYSYEHNLNFIYYLCLLRIKKVDV